MAALSPARAVSVDVDGTLYRVRRARVAWRLRRERGLVVALMAAREKIRREPPLPDRAALEAREVELVAPSLELDPDEARARLDRLKAELPAALTRAMRPHPGVRGALEAAAARGLALAALSDFDPAPKLRFLGLEDLPWSAMVGAEAQGALKPQRAPFDRLVELLGVPREAVVHVGDREEIDVRGALDAGLRAWRFAAAGEPSAAEVVFSRWRFDLFAPLVPA
jgi:putative hydrolase of the HAD superfamily